MLIRAFKPTDVGAAAAVFREAVITLGPQAYDADEVKMWASLSDDLTKFGAQLSKGLTLIGEEDARAAVFGQLEPVDCVAMLYCSSPFFRRGYATAVLRLLEAHAELRKIIKLHTHASRISRPFFARQGYAVTEVEHVTRQGVEFERFKMQKVLNVHGE